MDPWPAASPGGPSAGPANALPSSSQGDIQTTSSDLEKRNLQGDALIENVRDSPSREPKLVERYRAALREYIDAARSLDGLTGREFEKAYQRAEEARVTFEHLRGQLKDE